MKCTANELQKIRDELEKAGVVISNMEFIAIVDLCNRKIELNHLDNSYMKLLLPDEIKHFSVRRAINTLSKEMEELKNGTDYKKPVPCGC